MIAVTTLGIGLGRYDNAYLKTSDDRVEACWLNKNYVYSMVVPAAVVILS